MHTVSIDGKAVSVFLGNKPGIPVIYLNTYSDEGQQVFEAVQAVGCLPFNLATISNLDWNHDMAPWDNPAAFKKGEPFTGGADDYLRLLVEEIIPRAEKELAGPSGVAGNRRILLGRVIRPVRYLPDGCILPGGQYVRFPVVPRFQGVHLHPRAKASAGLHLFLSGGQRVQDP